MRCRSEALNKLGKLASSEAALALSKIHENGIILDFTDVSLLSIDRIKQNMENMKDDFMGIHMEIGRASCSERG